MQLNAKTSALVLIDLQKGVLAMSVAPHPAAALYERSMHLAEHFSAVGAPYHCRPETSYSLLTSPLA